MSEVLLVRKLCRMRQDFISYSMSPLRKKHVCFFMSVEMLVYTTAECFWNLLLLIVPWEKCRTSVYKEAVQTCKKKATILFSLSCLSNLEKGLGHGLTMWFWLYIQLFWTVLSSNIFQYTGEEILANIRSSCKGGQQRYTLSNWNISGLVQFSAGILRSKQPKP